MVLTPETLLRLWLRQKKSSSFQLFREYYLFNAYLNTMHNWKMMVLCSTFLFLPFCPFYFALFAVFVCLCPTLHLMYSSFFSFLTFSSTILLCSHFLRFSSHFTHYLLLLWNLFSPPYFTNFTLLPKSFGCYLLFVAPTFEELSFLFVQTMNNFSLFEVSWFEKSKCDRYTPAIKCKNCR